LRSDDQVNLYLERKKAETIEDARAHMRRLEENREQDGLYYWGMERLEDKNLIGTICLWNLDRQTKTAEIGYELLPQYQGMGLMQEALEAIINYAFTEIGLTALTAWTHKENVASSRLLERNGFKRDLEEEARNGNIDPMVIYILVKGN
jgi:ribosomal-protein-alanine N-acetyltransferase